MMGKSRRRETKRGIFKLNVGWERKCGDEAYLYLSKYEHIIKMWTFAGYLNSMGRSIEIVLINLIFMVICESSMKN